MFGLRLEETLVKVNGYVTPALHVPQQVGIAQVAMIYPCSYA